MLLKVDCSRLLSHTQFVVTIFSYLRYVDFMFGLIQGFTRYVSRGCSEIEGSSNSIYVGQGP